MTRENFEHHFHIGQIVPSGGPRSTLRVDRIGDKWFSVVPVAGKHQMPMRMTFDQLSAVIDGFSEIDPRRIAPTIQAVLTSRGQQEEHTTENYLYGFARAYLRSIEVDTPPLAEEISQPILYSEGAKKVIVVNAYERDNSARSACLREYGTRCCVCGMDFGEVYGEMGVGFIHVHHLKPIAARGGTYVLDPIQDLRPVCANCHAMLHQEDPPIPPLVLKARLLARSHPFHLEQLPRL